MKFKKSMATLVLLMFTLCLASPALAGTFTLQWDYSDADEDTMTQWRWWFDAADYASGTVKNEGLTADATSVDADTYETTVDTTGLAPDGAHTLKLQVNDGTEWSLEDTITIKLDTTIPNIIITEPTGWENADITVNIQHNDGEGSGVTSADYVITTDELEPEAGWTALSSNNEDISITTEGQWYVHVQATDDVTNRNWQFKGPFQLDKTLPTGAITSHSNGNFINGDISITGTANDDLSGLQLVEVSMDNENTFNPATDTDNWSYNFTVPVGDPENTEYQLIARVTDNAGNQFLTPAISLFKNSLPPTTTWTTADNSYHKGNLDLEGTSSDANIVDYVDLTYQFNGGAVTPIITLNNTTNTEPFNWTTTFTFPDGDGNYTFYASATDKGGLTETPAVQLTNIYRDTAGPVINIVGPSTTVKESITVTGSATDTHQSTVTLTLDGNPVVLDGIGNFTETLTLSPGSNTFVFEATDGAGNTTTENYIVTRGQPDAPVVTPTSFINSIQYDWAAVTDADGYEISTDNNAWTDLGSVITTTVDTLTPNTSVTRYFRSYAGTLIKMYSDSTTVTTSTLANIPTISSINVIDDQTIEVQMGLNGNPVGTEMQVQVMDGVIEAALTPWSDNTTVQVNGLEGNKNYQVNVRARSFGGIETAWVDAGIHLTKPSPAELILKDVETGELLVEDYGVVLLNKLIFDLNVNTQAGVTYKYKLSSNPEDLISGGDPTYITGTPIIIPADGVWYLIIEGTNITGATRIVKQIIADTTAPSFTIH